MNRYLKAFAIGTFVLGSTAAVCQAEDDAMQMALLRMQNQITDLQNRLAESQGQIESLEHELALVTEENGRLKQQLASSANAGSQAGTQKDSKNTLEKTSGEGNASIKPSDGTAQNQQPAALPQEAKTEYDRAYALVDSKKYDEAVNAFKAYVEKYEDNALTPNAWYWMGQIQYSQKKYEEARVSFLHTAKFQTSNKRMDALYKLGIISKALGDNEKAKRFFDLLIKSYPNTTSALMAKKEMDALN